MIDVGTERTDIARRIRRLMKARGIKSQNELARKLGIKAGTVSHWLNEERTPETKAMRELARVLQTTMDTLANGGPEMAPGEPWPDQTDDDLDLVDIVAMDPKRYTALEIATAAMARHKKGRPDGGWRPFLDTVRREIRRSRSPSKAKDLHALIHRIESPDYKP